LKQEALSHPIVNSRVGVSDKTSSRH
jgi:hypothetical protein